ncbi:pectate lyase superfamily protein [Metarhizium robertsii]|uniref:Pectate lyase superfamily protein n=1 Tax=Metarhizium robertsii TaxID=568076 RepID=A0A014N5W6_9HYPO|nr:pectate lyase superfamily protein [Metarhizium robertsii]
MRFLRGLLFVLPSWGVTVEPRDVQGGFWLGSLAQAGKSPLAPSGYEVFRSVKDFGAIGDGVTDDTAAINRAAAMLNMSSTDTRCEADCGSTTVLAAVVYFPPGTYLVSSPIIQYYHTQFVGDAVSKPVIKGSNNFAGIALMDSNVYIPQGNGSQWYINQSNFLRQIRNFVFDMTGMEPHNQQGGQAFVPTGIHWQVGQATSITNCDFKMDVADGQRATTSVGIMMENGSGGVVSDLTFFGGNIGFIAGSQQFTASNLQFTSCLTAIKHLWNWGFTWKNIYVQYCPVAIDCTEYSPATQQGTGSVAVVDSYFHDVTNAITILRNGDQQPSIVLENLQVQNSQSVVQVIGGTGETILPGSSGMLYFDTWVSGVQYLPNGISGTKKSAFITPATNKPQSLLDDFDRYLVRAKPQYEDVEAGNIVVATHNGVSNDGTGDQTDAINAMLSGNVGSVIFFPAGIYQVQGTVKVPVGSKIVGSSWSQIRGTGPYFSKESDPRVMVQVGNDGDSGVIEISDMMFTVKGATAGCILMEWNVHESGRGSAAMWDSHFRVGGAAGSDLQLQDCPLGWATEAKCKAAAMLMHVTQTASGYFDNVWLWVADHDLDSPLNADAVEGPGGIPMTAQTQISIYVGRGLLVESQGPTWFYGTSSEHSQMYQYELLGAKNVYMGHLQTETPYYQPYPDALRPYELGAMAGDPTFSDCNDSLCRGAWALRVINSTDVVIYSAGFYSFFQNNWLGCALNENCQLALMETSYSERLWAYNIFTKGNVQIVSPRGGLPPVLFDDTTRNGYTSEIAAWLELSQGGGNIGVDDIYLDLKIWQGPLATVSCRPPCTYILPPIPLQSPTTIMFPPSSTSLEVGWFTDTTYIGDDGQYTATVEYVVVTVTTTLTIPNLVVSSLPVSNVAIPPGVNSTTIYAETSLLPPPFVITDDKGPTGRIVNRTITPKPWPWSNGPASTQTTSNNALLFVVHTFGPPGPVCTGGCGIKCKNYCNWPCQDGCNGGEDCKYGGCTHGGDCSGDDCTGGGDCESDNCDRGGDCHGSHCQRGGGCVGPSCRRPGICHPFPCPETGGCVGPLCGTFEDDDPDIKDFQDPTDPNHVSEREPDECTTKTFSTCSTLCLASPATTCWTACSTGVGCDETDSSWLATETPAPAYAVGVLELWPDIPSPDPELPAVAQSVIQALSFLGDFGDSGTSTIQTAVSCYDPRDTCYKTGYSTRCETVARVAGHVGPRQGMETGQTPSATPRPVLVRPVQRDDAENGSESSTSIVSSPSSHAPSLRIDARRAPGRYIPINFDGSGNISRVVSVSSNISPLPAMDLSLPGESCTVEPFCICQGPYTTCLYIWVEKDHYIGSGVSFIVQVKENDRLICDVTMECGDCDGGHAECTDGSSIEWLNYEAQYYSKTQDFTFVVRLIEVQPSGHHCGKADSLNLLSQS